MAVVFLGARGGGFAVPRRPAADPPPTDSPEGEAALEPRNLAAIKAFQCSFGVERNTYDLSNL